MNDSTVHEDPIEFYTIETPYERLVELVVSYKPRPMNLLGVYERFAESLKLKEGGMSWEERKQVCLDSVLRDAETGQVGDLR